MQVFLGRHARLKMRQRAITPSTVAAVLETPARDLILKYYGVAEGESVAVVVTFDVDPPFVVTVMRVDA